MNLRDLKYLIAVAETEHFGHAASRCFVSQPTLSGQIKKLEQELGVTLFERTNRSVSITPIGAEIVRHAKLILEQADVIKQLAQAQRDPLAGALRVGAIPTVSPYLIPLILLPLKRQYPQMRLVLSEEITEMLTRRLLEHQIDVAILATDVKEPELEVMPLFEEPFWLAHPRDHEIYNKDENNPNRGIAEIILAKQRNGPVGDVKLTFLNAYTRFENLAPEEAGTPM